MPTQLQKMEARVDTLEKQVSFLISDFEKTLANAIDKVVGEYEAQEITRQGEVELMHTLMGENND